MSFVPCLPMYLTAFGQYFKKKKKFYLWQISGKIFFTISEI